MRELLELSALELGAAIEKGEVSIAEATQAALDSMAEHVGSLNCFITQAGEEALARAAALQAGAKGAEIRCIADDYVTNPRSFGLIVSGINRKIYL